MRISKSTLDKLQKILESQQYIVRYEKGNFKGGYCLLHHQKTIILNKFYPLEGMVQALVEIVRAIDITDKEAMPDELWKLARMIRDNKVEKEEGNE